MKTFAVVVGYVLLSSWSHGVCASDARHREPALPVSDSGHPPKPPEEAYTACKGHAEGDACSVQFHNESLAGTCRKLPGEEGELVCIPANMPSAPGH